MTILDSAIFDEAISALRRRSKLALYQSDFAAWQWDVLGLRSYKKLQGICDDALFGPTTRTMVKSSNGTGKSFVMAAMILWAGSVFEEGETVSIVSAPSIPQLMKVTWAYLKSFHGRSTVTPEGFLIPGRIDENLGWVSETPSGKIWLASGRKPPEQDAVSMFQGLRSQFGMTYVWFDEAGGMSKEMFTAAEAVMTGALARFFGIGNPDHTGTEFQRIFTDKALAAEYNLHTISAFDLPTFTGERVYPYTDEGDVMEKRMLSALTSVEWVEHKKRVWGENDARYLSKVLGEFPGDSDFAFFPQRIIDIAHETDIPEDMDIPMVLGVDVARFGQDESVVYGNRGGRVRLLDSWGKADALDTARRIHRIAVEQGATEVRIDTAGVGGPVYDNLRGLAEFRNPDGLLPYLPIGIDGSAASPDLRRWLNARAHNHEQLRDLMAGGQVDLDFEDRELSKQLVNVTYKYSERRGAVQIASKTDMRTEMDGSPDRLDAVIYAVLDTAPLLRALGLPQPGEIVFMDPWTMLQQSREDENYPL